MADPSRDRQSRMPYSTVQAPAKKDGAGGSYTWGGAMDVKDYESQGVQGAKVTTAPASAPAPVEKQPSAGTIGLRIDSEGQFPSLSKKVDRSLEAPESPIEDPSDEAKPRPLPASLVAQARGPVAESKFPGPSCCAKPVEPPPAQKSKLACFAWCSK
mmetsp:Transcript_98172/g.179925  ORF Transcript_98172/g.179925 Transcript_98172/m.179925 type:complete len:157 (-) Transcript_98172:226-696(-)